MHALCSDPVRLGEKSGSNMNITPTTNVKNKLTPLHNNSLWYFAIGSMMNPASMENRSIKPISSVPGELLDYELVFSGGMGFAEAVQKSGSSFHGVLHLVDDETMARLDKIELTYKRVEGQARMYDGTTVTATVYTKISDDIGQGNNPPHQRYLDIMLEGANHFNVHEDQINFLKSVKCIPRPMPNEFQSIGELPADAPLLTYEQDVEPYNGVDKPILRLAVNGKVLQICVSDVKDSDANVFNRALNLYKQYGHRLEIVYSRVMFDPKYGCPENVNDFTKEHVDYIEHNHYIISTHHNTANLWRCIGRIEQQYKDD